MKLAALEKLGDTIVLTLPEEIIKALHLHAGEELTIAVEGERLVLTRLPALFRDARVVYQTLEHCYREAQVAS
jgi:antitoxin component of MazEF toxin-antitoxin module